MGRKKREEQGDEWGERDRHGRDHRKGGLRRHRGGRREMKGSMAESQTEWTQSIRKD